MRRKISQREARRTAKRLQEVQEKYESLIRRYRYPLSAVALREFTFNDVSKEVFAAVGKLGFPLAAHVAGDKMTIYAIKP